jgi:hypothetical protein
MWFRQLEYPRVQSYAIPYITELFYGISTVIIVVLVALNGESVAFEHSVVLNTTYRDQWRLLATMLSLNLRTAQTTQIPSGGRLVGYPLA